MKTIFISIIFLHVSLLYGQSSLDDYKLFTPERRLVLSKMGEFFDDTVRKNFPAEVDTLSYLYFIRCFWQTGAEGLHVILDVDRTKLKEINQMLFKDHNYYFFYARYIYMKQSRPLGYDYPIDSIPTIREFGNVVRKKYVVTDVALNWNGYIKVMSDDNPAIRRVKENFAAAGCCTLTMTSFSIKDMGREVSQPEVKEYCAVIFWKYLCLLGGFDFEGRKPICEPCDLL